MIIDKSRQFGYAAPKLPKFKGHVKITLHNCRTGKNEVIEGENIVTNAVRDILAANYLGAVDYGKLFGSDGLWKKWFGGVLLYEQAHPTETVGGVQVLNPDDYYPRGDNVSHVFAHAGQNSVDSLHDDDLTRGNPVSAAFVQTEDTIKQVWEWGSIRGNVPDGRFIRALSLTHSDVGDAGLGSDTYAFQNFNPLESIAVSSLPAGVQGLNGGDNIAAQYDDSHGLYFHIGEPADYYGGHIGFETQKISVYIRKMAFFKAGLYDTQNGKLDYQKTITVTTSTTFFCNPSYYFDYTTKRLWLFTNVTAITNRGRPSSYSTSVISYSVLDLSDLDNVTEYAHGTITSDTSNIAMLCASCNDSNDWSNSRRWFYNIMKIGDYFYFPTSNGWSGSPEGAGTWYMNCTGYKKINFTNQADQASIPFLTAKDIFTPSIGGGGIIINSGRVVNGNTGYTCLDQYTPAAGGGTVDTTRCFCQPNKPSSLLTTIGNMPNNTATRYIFANKMLNTTLFNLPNPVQKTSSQSMTVEYTIQEVHGGDES